MEKIFRKFLLSCFVLIICVLLGCENAQPNNTQLVYGRYIVESEEYIAGNEVLKIQLVQLFDNDHDITWYSDGAEVIIGDCVEFHAAISFRDSDLTIVNFNDRPTACFSLEVGHGTAYSKYTALLYDVYSGSRIEIPDFDSVFAEVVRKDESDRMDMSSFSEDILDKSYSYVWATRNDSIFDVEINWFEFADNNLKMCFALYPYGKGYLEYVFQNGEFVLTKLGMGYDPDDENN